MKKKNIGGIYLDEKSNTYFVSTTFTDLGKNRHKIAKRGFTSLDEAIRWKEKTKLYYSENYVNQSGRAISELASFVNLYIESKKRNCKETTVMQNESTLRLYFVDYFNKERITNLDVITPTQINNYYTFLSKIDMKEQSKNIHLSRIIGFIEWLDLMEYISPSVTRKFKKILVPFEVREKPKNDFLSFDELAKILNTFDGTNRNDEYYKFAIMFLAYSGLRRSELYGLTWNDVDFENNRVLVNKQYQMTLGKVVPYTKTNTTRNVIIPNWLTEQLFNYYKSVCKNKRFTMDDFIFPERNINNRLKQACDMAGVKEVKVHDLRHTFCTMLYDNGASGKYVQSQMGHSSENTSKAIYEHLTGRMLDEGIELTNKLKRV